MGQTDESLRSDLRSTVNQICASYDLQYWREKDEAREYPLEFVNAATEAGLTAVMVPERFGGFGLGVADAGVVVEEINRVGGNASALHAQMFMMGILVRHAADEQAAEFLPEIAAGNLRLQTFAITEPNIGTNTTRVATSAKRTANGWSIDGQKVFISRFEQSDLMLLLARTRPIDDDNPPAGGLSLFLCDLRGEGRKGITSRRISLMFNHPTYELFFDNYELPEEALVGEEGRGFRYLLDGLNAERILVSAESVGDAKWFIEKAVDYANTRIVFDRPIGQNQGVQFPIARAYVNMEAANLMRDKAASLFDQNLPCGKEANMAKLLATEASWEAGNVAMQTHGGFGLATEYDIERKFREARVFQVAPISTNMVLNYIGEHVLGMPRSY
jgi:acyl-CoA dehydrogenase